MTEIERDCSNARIGCAMVPLIRARLAELGSLLRAQVLVRSSSSDKCMDRLLPCSHGEQGSVQRVS